MPKVVNKRPKNGVVELCIPAHSGFTLLTIATAQLSEDGTRYRWALRDNVVARKKKFPRRSGGAETLGDAIADVQKLIDESEMVING